MLLPAIPGVRFDASDGPDGVAVARVDRMPMRGPRVRADGFIEAEGVITRAGVFVYRDAQGRERRELRPPDEVFDAESLSSFALVPLTLEHPAANLTPDTVGQHQVGSVGTPVRDGELARTPLLITHRDAIKAVEGGKQELSCGYTAMLVAAPGVWRDAAGQEHRFDAVQRRIRGNHVAIVDRGRAGPAARIRLDAAGDAAVTEHRDEDDGDDQMKTKITINGQTFEVDTALAEKMRADGALDANFVAVAPPPADPAPKADAAELERLKGENEQLKGRLDAAEAKAKADAEAKEKADSAEQVARAVEARIDVVGRAAGVLTDAKLEDLVRADELELMRRVVAKEVPGVSLEGRSDDYVRGVFGTATARIDTAAALAKLVSAAAGDKDGKPADRKDGDEDPIAAARKRQHERMGAGWGENKAG